MKIIAFDLGKNFAWAHTASMLTGRKLFTKNNVVATVLAIEQGQISAPSVFEPELPRDLDAVVMRGLSREPEKRFPDARAMAGALDELIPKIEGPTLEEFVEIGEMAEAAVRALNAGVLRDEAEIASRAASCAPNRGDPKQSNDQQTP